MGESWFAPNSDESKIQTEKALEADRASRKLHINQLPSSTPEDLEEDTTIVEPASKSRRLLAS